MPSRNQLWKQTGRDPVAVLRELADSGYGPEVAASIIGVCGETAKRWAAAHGIDLPRRTVAEKIIHAKPGKSALDSASKVRSRWIEWSGGRERMIDAAKRLGVTPDCLRVRIKRWGVEAAMTEPRRPAFYGVKARKPADGHPWRESVVDKRQAELSAGAGR